MSEDLPKFGSFHKYFALVNLRAIIYNYFYIFSLRKLFIIKNRRTFL